MKQAPAIHQPQAAQRSSRLWNAAVAESFLDGLGSLGFLFTPAIRPGSSRNLISPAPGEIPHNLHSEPRPLPFQDGGNVLDDQLDVMDALSDTLSKINAQLESCDSPGHFDDWDTLALRAQRIDQQLNALIHKQFQDDDATFKSAASELSSATKELDNELATTQRVDKLMHLVAQISAAAEELQQFSAEIATPFLACKDPALLPEERFRRNERARWTVSLLLQIPDRLKLLRQILYRPKGRTPHERMPDFPGSEPSHAG